MVEPLAASKPEVIVTHGDTRIDEYAWLKDSQNSDVVAYIRAENDYADAFMKPTALLQKKVYREIKSRIKEDDQSVPVKDGPFYYYNRTKKGAQYAIHCRIPAAFMTPSGTRKKAGKEQVILDENDLAQGSNFFALGEADVSPDHRLLAYTTDLTGNEKFTLRIKNLESGEMLPDSIESVSAVVWAADNTHLFYSKEEHPFPPRKIYRHKLGDDPSLDQLIYEEVDPQWYVSIGKSRSKEYLFIYVANFDATEVRYLKADEPYATPLLIAERRPKVKYSVEHHGDYFYIVTNERAVNYKVMRAPKETPGRAHWREWLAYRKDRAITDFVAHRDFLSLIIRENGSAWIYLIDPVTKTEHRIPLPESEHTVSLWSNTEFDAGFARFSYSSFLTPNTTYDYDVRTKKLAVRKRQPVPRWNAKKYVSKRVWAQNGTVQIPISVCYRKDVKLDGKAPILLDAYGSYGIVSDPRFSVARLPLLERGFIIATAHPRGGGEMGWSWHEAAKLRTKHRTYQDVIACADLLIEKKFGARERLAITGGSAGGMTMGAVLNLRPDLCGAAIVYVPNADTVTSMLDTSLGGTTLHYDELGDPRTPEAYEYLKRWSPYENIRHAHYPAMLVRASLFDIRTPYWEAAKWVARLRAQRASNNPLLLKIEMHAGHGGKSGRYEWIKERAYDYAFLLKLFGFKK